MANFPCGAYLSPPPRRIKCSLGILEFFQLFLGVFLSFFWCCRVYLGDFVCFCLFWVFCVFWRFLVFLNVMVKSGHIWKGQVISDQVKSGQAK